jgi:hypothetical protein
VRYLHIDSKENVSDCLTKHLPHPRLWALVKEHLFHRWADCKVTFSEIVPDGYAPDRECQARNGIGQEQVTNSQEGWSEPWFAFSEPLYLPSTGQCYLATVMIDGQCSIVPVYFGNQALTDVHQEPSEKGWTNVDGQVNPSNVGP